MDVWFKRLSDEMENAIAGMPSDALEWAPAGKWNAANVIEHLARTFGGTAKGVEAALAKAGDPAVPAPTPKQRLAIFVVTSLGCFPTGRKSPILVEPSGLDSETAMRSFRENLARMDAAVAAAAQRWGTARIAVHPILGPLTARQWRRFHFIHTRHHAKQVRALKEIFAAKGKAA